MNAAQTIPLLARWQGYPCPERLPVPISSKRASDRITKEDVLCRLNPDAAAIFTAKLITTRPNIAVQLVPRMAERLNRLAGLPEKFTLVDVLDQLYPGAKSQSAAKLFIANCIKDRLVSVTKEKSGNHILYVKEVV